MGGENIKHRKKRIAFFIFTTMPLVLCNTVYAVTTSEIQAAVDSQGKDAVAGNIFIWFLCAIAFLKISQKIDSFMSGLGVNVGHTGGSMMAEAMIVARSLGVGGKGLLNKGFGGGSSTGGSTGSGEKGGFLSGGLAGVVGRSFNNSAMNAATGKDAGLFGKKAFESSLKSGGDLAKDVIGKVAKGDIAKTGSITGETADKALSAYLGYDGGAAMLDFDTSGSSTIPTEIGGIEENTDSVTPVEAAGGAPEIGTPPEPDVVSDVPGARVSSTPESAKDGVTTATTPEEIPMESTSDTITSGEMPGIDYQPEIQSDMGTDIGEQPEISAAGSEQAETVTADENTSLQPETKIPMNPDTTDITTGETSTPTVMASDGMPELPEIVPDYESAEDSDHPVTIIPDTQSGIPSSASEAASISDSTQAVSGDSIVPPETNTVTTQTAAASGAVVSPVHVPQPAISQPSGASPAAAAGTQSGSSAVSGATPAQSGSAPVAVTQPTSGVSTPTNQTQVNTVSNTASSTVNTNADVNASAAVTQQEHINSPVTMPTDSSVSIPASSRGNESIGSMPQLTSGNGLGQNTANIPVFSNVEIGGGRIMGTETSDKHPNGVEFGMYNTAQYMKPEGEFSTVKTVDGAKWYKQYAAPKVERTPIVEENGKIKYEEKIVNKLPPVPRRKDKV